MFVNSFQFCIIRFINTLICQTDNPAWFQTKEDLSRILDLATVLQLLRGQGVSVPKENISLFLQKYFIIPLKIFRCIRTFEQESASPWQPPLDLPSNLDSLHRCKTPIVLLEDLICKSKDENYKV